MIYRLAVAALAACWINPMAIAQPQEGDQPKLSPRQQQLIASIRWDDGPLDGKLGSIATIKVPAGHHFTDATGAKAYMELMGNPPSSRLLGIVEPLGKATWLVEFSYEDVGYVKDTEKDNIDADAILESIKAGTEQANKLRASMGVPPLSIVGWEQKPAYSTETNRLSWAIRGQSEGQPIINYNTRILGRGGVMSANLIVEPQDMAKVIPEFNKMLAGYSFVPGQTHAEFRAGDKVAEYGLTALVAGGAVAVAAKSGLLGKLLKPIIIGLVVLGSFFGKIYGAIFGRKKADADSED
jgi:uncharacterized membrane-anchored protein